MYYNSEDLGNIEGFTVDICHASNYILQMLDDVQPSFLTSLDLSEEDAFGEFHLTHLCASRDIAMLGLLQRVVLGVVPPSLQSLLPGADGTLFSHGFRHGPSHSKQLADPIMPGHGGLFKRSLSGLVAVYDPLPGSAVSCGSVRAFQAALQRILKSRVGASWRHVFSRTF